MKTSAKIALVVGILCIVIALVIGVWLVLSHTSAHTEPDPLDTFEVEDDADGFPEIDWDYWLSINPDIVGWITIPDTTVNYPIVKAPADNPTFYLKHDIYKNWNYVGVPYLDAECDGNLWSTNAPIFAHHLKVGEPMFAPLANYNDATFVDEHSEILIQTPTTKRKLTVMAVARVKGSDTTKRVTFSDREDFVSWYQERLGEATVIRDASVPVRVTSLITCSYDIWPSNERTIVYVADTSDIPMQLQSINQEDDKDE